MKTFCFIFSFLFFFCSTGTSQLAQYATAGTGNMRNYICWFDWAGRTVANNATSTFTTPDGLSVTISFSNVSGPSLTPSVMNTWSGAVLWNLYDFTSAAVKPALYSVNTPMPLNFTMTITATRGGVPTPFTFVAADAEASDVNEIIQFKTSGTAWRTIEFFRNSNQTANPLVGCGTQTVSLSQTYGHAPNTGQNPILATDATGNLTVNTSFSIGGGTGVAFGIFAPIDRGDLPAPFPTAHHGLRFTTSNSCNYSPPFPNIIQDLSLVLGTLPGDADGIQSSDDNLSGPDEDAITSFPIYDGSGNYSLALKLKNVTGKPAYLTGWFDYNRNGIFSNNEAVTITIPDGSTTATLTWTGLPASFPNGNIADFGFRLRLASSVSDVSTPDGYAHNGEVEDYFVSYKTIIPNTIASFSAPDTVCVNTPVNIANASVGTSSHFWNFCVANTNDAPIGNNMGNIGSAFRLPVYMDYVFEDGNYYGFLTNNFPGKLLRLNFGNSLLNTPTVTDLGTAGGAVPNYTEGLQVVKNEGKWYVIIVGGNTSGAPPAIGKVELGTNIANNSPTGINWGNIGNLDYPHDLYMFNDNGRWYGFTVNTNNNTITRFDFTSSFSNTPTGTNLGNIGGLDGPTGVYAINDNGNWHVFVTNAYNSSLTRLDFGGSLLNTPTGHNLGNIDGKFQRLWDIQIMKFCGELSGFAINAGNAELLKLDFGNNITNVPTVITYGNVGNLSFPHCLSKIFRVGSDLYSFIPNVDNNTLSRIRFPGCTSVSITSSSLPNPPAIVYNTPGTYNINLTVDDGLPTQTSICKQIVVLPTPAHLPLKTLSVCSGDSIKVGASTKFSTYLWNTGSVGDSIYLSKAGTYWVEANQKGCINRDSFTLNIRPGPVINLKADTVVCLGESIRLTANPSGTYTYNWMPATSLSDANSESPIATPTSSTSYVVEATSIDGCIAKDTTRVEVLSKPVISLIKDTSICKNSTVLLTASGGVSYNWFPIEGLSSSSTPSPLATPLVSTKYFVTVTDMNSCTNIDSVFISIREPVVFQKPDNQEVCKGEVVQLISNNNNYDHLWSPAISLSSDSEKSPFASPLVTTTYRVLITDPVCKENTTFDVEVKVKPTPVIRIEKSNDIDCSKQSAQLMALGGNVYSWQPAMWLDNPNKANPITTAQVSTTYKVTGTNEEGCSGSDSILVDVKYIGDLGLFLPNAFTPNNDGRNDCYGIKKWQVDGKVELSIFNRWGELMFLTKDPTQCWNGTYKGTLAPSGVYIYVVKGATSCGEFKRSGTFTLIR